MPTICLDCRYINGTPSGIGEIVQALVDRLPRLAPQWRFLFLRHPFSVHPLSDADNVVEKVVPWATNGPASMWLLPALVDLDGIDLFHAPSNILPRGLGMPCVTTIHDAMWLTQPDLCNPRPWGRVEGAFYRHGMRRAIARSAAVLTVSEATRRELIALDPAVASRSRVTLPGVSQRFARRKDETQDLKLPGIGQGRYILTVGQYAPYKNHERAIEAFAAAFGSDRTMAFVLVQRQGPSSARLLELARKLGIVDRVQLLARVDEDQLISLYSGATALLHPSLCEGFGMPIAEAMACGCPVVTSDRSAMPEVAAGAALLVDPEDTASIADALARIANDRELARDLSNRGKARAGMLQWSEFAAANLAAYREVLEAA